ncbi:MAG: hypothetical protein LBV67_06315 [Streptococcaceae bacterium]|jgi:hypothetical protein|nr:hypothetical protein [Streptococcaceae bacterium]
MTNKQKLITTIAGVAIVGSIAFGVNEQIASQRLEKNIALLETLDTQTTDYLTNAKTLVNIETGMLAKDMNKGKIDTVVSSDPQADQSTDDITTKSLKKQVSKVDDNQELANNYVELATKNLAYQNEVNNLFTKVALNGSDISKDNTLVKEVKAEELKDLQDYLSTEPKKDNQFKSAVRGLVKQAVDQQKVVADANKAVDASVKDKGNRDLNNKAISAVNKIKNADVKRDLLGKVNPIKSDLDKKDADAKAKAEADNQAQANANNEQAQNVDNGVIADGGSYQGGNTGGNYDTGSGGGYTGGGNTGGSGNNGGSTGGGNSGGNTGGNGGGTVTPPPSMVLHAWVANAETGQILERRDFNTIQEVNAWEIERSDYYLSLGILVRTGYNS